MEYRSSWILSEIPNFDVECFFDLNGNEQLLCDTSIFPLKFNAMKSPLVWLVYVELSDLKKYDTGHCH